MFRKPLTEYEIVSLATGIDVRRFSWIRPLAGDYADNYQNVAPLYAGDPTSADAWREAITRVRRHARRPHEVAGIVRRQQTDRAAPPEARAAAARLENPDTVAIVTGQQAGAFGGPLFTLLKALTAIQLARRTSTEHGVDAVAIFWVDAEDHDWDEVRSVTVLDAHFHPTTIELDPPEGAGHVPIAAVRLDDRVTRAVDELQAALPVTDFTEWTMAGVRGAWKPGERMASAFARWLEGLLGPLGLVVFESADPAAKPLVADLFARELQLPGKTATLAADAGAALQARGHQPQVVPQLDSLSLFRLEEARRPIRRQGDGFLVGENVHSASALAAEAVDHPERFSPNVLLRPIVQDTLFPTICYVAGPSELAYLGQLRGVYEHFGVPMPLMYPRASVTLIDSATARFLSKYNVPIEDLQPQDESALNRLLEQQLPKVVEEAINDAEETIRRTMTRVIEVMPEVDPTLAGAAKTTLGRIDHDLKGLRGKMIQAAKKRDETLRRQFSRAQSQMFPLGHPQERTLGVVFFLNRYGPALVDRLLEELPLDLGKHWIVTL
jgi:bacillithiol biosynthesis cysteine-adding enzyme BshC